MTVVHQVGRLDIKADQIINSMSGTRGLFRKEPWERTESIAISELVEIRVSEQLDGSVSLSFTRDAREGPVHTKPSTTEELAQGFTNCRPPEAIERFLQEAHEVNPTISIEWTSVRGDLASASSIRVKTYRSGAEYERDAPRMVAAGWRPEDQTALAGHVNVRRTTARVLLGGFLAGGASRSRTKSLSLG